MFKRLEKNLTNGIRVLVIMMMLIVFASLIPYEIYVFGRDFDDKADQTTRQYAQMINADISMLQKGVERFYIDDLADALKNDDTAYVTEKFRQFALTNYNVDLVVPGRRFYSRGIREESPEIFERYERYCSEPSWEIYDNTFEYLIPIRDGDEAIAFFRAPYQPRVSKSIFLKYSNIYMLDKDNRILCVRNGLKMKQDNNSVLAIRDGRKPEWADRSLTRSVQGENADIVFVISRKLVFYESMALVTISLIAFVVLFGLINIFINDFIKGVVRRLTSLIVQMDDYIDKKQG